MTVLLVSFTIGRALAPRTASSYLSAVKKYLENEGVDTKFFKHSQYIRNTKQGLTLAYRVQTNRTSLDAARLPITADMIILYYKVTAPHRPTLQQRALFVAQLTGFTMVARVSEYLYTSKSEHWLTTDRVLFEMQDGTTIPAQHAHKHVSTTSIAVHIHIRTRKTIKRDAAIRYTFTAPTQRTNTVTSPKCGHTLPAHAQSPKGHSSPYRPKTGL